MANSKKLLETTRRDHPDGKSFLRWKVKIHSIPSNGEIPPSCGPNTSIGPPARHLMKSPLRWGVKVHAIPSYGEIPPLHGPADTSGPPAVDAEENPPFGVGWKSILCQAMVEFRYRGPAITTGPPGVMLRKNPSFGCKVKSPARPYAVVQPYKWELTNLYKINCSY